MLHGCIITTDALGCQTAITAAITVQGADYVLARTENQEGLCSAITAAFNALSTGRIA